MSFTNAINKWVEQAKTDRDTVVTEIFQTMGTRIVSGTPLGDISLWKIPPPASQDYRPGTLVNNWFAGFGEPGTPSMRPHNVTGAQSLANIAKTAKEFPGQIAHLINPSPYANRIEYEGHSSQAPSGMVRRTVAEFQQIVTVAVNGVK